MRVSEVLMRMGRSEKVWLLNQGFTAFIQKIFTTVRRADALEDDK